MRKNRFEAKYFSLIEQAVVITIIGILVAVAIPKFIDLGAEAETTTVAAIAWVLSSASAKNKASRSLNTSLGVPVTNCTDIANTLEGGLPSGYTITSAPISAGSTVTCKLKGPGSSSTTFTATGTD